MKVLLISIFPALVVTWLVFGRYLSFEIPRHRKERRNFAPPLEPGTMTVGRRRDDNVASER